MTHDLKCWPGSWEAVASGLKKHEIRVADRDFKVGDDVILREFMPNVAEHGPVVWAGKITGNFTGRSLLRKITYVSAAGSFGLPPNLCVFSMDSYPERKDR